MNTSPIELISTFRKKITLQTLIALLLILAMIVAGILFLEKAGEHQASDRMGIFLLVLLAINIYGRRRTMLKFLNPQDPQATVSAFENYLAEKRESFSRTTKARLILGGLTTIVLILVLCFDPDSRYISIMALGLVFVVLLSMLVSWTLMQDAMMFQDLKHTMRNYPSEIS